MGAAGDLRQTTRTGRPAGDATERSEGAHSMSSERRMRLPPDWVCGHRGDLGGCAAAAPGAATAGDLAVAR